ncbi:hypothetical protein [Treponema pedis]|uniref:Lipoprotein n=1 Tax=Treponema pedis str. T A4 TaxID=1291379 RepID=S5ZR89_9SPIR|nr:hypothetical protein [Treponema pedis]AGT45197.1 hypothetical protein TPE_2725 [Treponema pedis str. T A4]
MKHKNKVFFIGMLIFAVCIIALSSGCSRTWKVQGVWQATGITEGGVSVPLESSFALYFCFTGNNIMYMAQKIDGSLVRSGPMAYTVDGNKLITGGAEGGTFVIKGKTATLTSERKDHTGTTVKTVMTFTKVSSPTVKEIEKAKEVPFH